MSGWGRWFFHLAASARVARFGEGVRPRLTPGYGFRPLALPRYLLPPHWCPVGGCPRGGIVASGKLALASFAAV